MKIAYFDCLFGAAGDMLNAALLAGGADQQRWRAELEKIALPKGSFGLSVSDVMRCHIACKKVEVFDGHGRKFDSLYDDQVVSLRPHAHEHRGAPTHEEKARHKHERADEQKSEPASQHRHEHGHEHKHDHEHKRRPRGSNGQAALAGHSPEPQAQQADQNEHRGLNQILALIHDSTITDAAKELSIRVFTRLARAEAKVHGVKAEAVHFHEVGALDAIIDIVGFAVAYDLLQIKKSFCSGLPLGRGRALTEHGLYPVPGPATLYLLEEAGALIAQSKFDYECLTPTGAAILCEVTGEWGRQPEMAAISGIGYGAGTMDPPDWPNACRVLIGEAGAREQVVEPARFDSQTIAVVEANLDDLNPQALAYAMERLFKAGALDVCVQPAVMKKGRSGHILTALCKPECRADIESAIFAQTSTIGVRWYEASRSLARRRFETVSLPLGTVRIKVALDNLGNVINAQPEFDDCAAYASLHQLPLKDVLNQAQAQYLKQASTGG